MKSSLLRNIVKDSKGEVTSILLVITIFIVAVFTVAILPIFTTINSGISYDQAVSRLAQGGGLTGDLDLNGHDIGDVDSITSNSINAPTGRSATLIVAASDATALEKAQADLVCDGTADDVQIQAAIDALAAGTGGKVLLSSGTFNISASIVLGDKTTPYSDPMILEGMGDATILYAINSLDASVIRTAAAALGSSIDLRHKIRNLKIDGNKDNQASGNGIDFYVYQGVIESVTIQYCKGVGLYVAGTAGAAVAVDCSFDKLNILYCGSHGAHLYGAYGSDTKFSQCNIYYNGGFGIYNQSSGNLMVSNSSIYSNTNTNIYFQNAWWAEIVGNQIGGAALSGISIQSGAGLSAQLVTIVGNKFNIIGAQDAGISLSGGSGFPVHSVTIEGNTFYSSAANADSGIKLTQYCEKITIANNAFVNASGWVQGPIWWGTTGISGITVANNSGYIAPGEIRTYAVTITAGNEDTTTYWQNPFAQNVWVSEVKFNLTTAASATNPTYDVKLDTDGSGVPDGTAFLDGVPDTAGTYWSYSNAYGGAASGVQTGYIQLASNASTSDWIGFCIEDAAGADSAGVIYITIMGQ